MPIEGTWKIDMVGDWDGVASGCAVALPADAACDAGMAPWRCPYCGSDRLGRWGRAESGVRRLRCGACDRSFGELRGTVLAGLHDLMAFRLVVDDMMGETHSSCRTLAMRLGLDKSTIWRWRKKINEALAFGDRGRIPWPVDGDLAKGDVVQLRESRKASREWVNHRQDPARFPAPDRPRWVDVDCGRLPPPTPLERYLVSVQLSIDPSGRAIARLLPVGALAAVGGRSRPGTAGVEYANAPAAAASTMGGASGPPFGPLAIDGLAAEAGASASAAADEAAGRHAAPGGCGRFKAFIRPFRGPATRHLEGYAAWFNIGSDDSKERRLATAWNLLLHDRPTEFADIRRCRADADCASAWRARAYG